MLTLGTHKNYKITSLTADSYKQLFVLITMLLTVLSVQQSTFAMAAPLQQQQQQKQLSSQLPIHTIDNQQLPSSHHYHPHYQQQQKHRYNHDDHHNQQQQQDQHQEQHPDIQLNFLLAENDHNNHNNHNHHNHQQLETDIETETERLHKRQIGWHDYYSKTMDSTKVEWYNPCNGIYVDIEKKKSKAKSKPAVKKALRTLQNTTVREYYALNVNQLHAIDIRNMSMWDKFDDDYKFLPNMKSNSRISLRRWYRQLQIYVASFDYLQRAQLYWDYNEGMQQSETSRELYALRNNAREVLCNIENAINKTTVNSKMKNTINSLFIPRKRMESLLHFYTDFQHISPLKWQQVKYDKNVIYVNPVDLRFAKSRYLRYIRTFIKFLRTTTRRLGPIYLGRKRQQEQAKRRQQKDKQNSKKT